KIEQEEKALIAEYEKMIAFAGSEALAKYTRLHESVNSAGFRQKKKEIESLTYKGSEEHARESEFLGLKKAKDIVSYFKTEGSALLKNFQSLDGSSRIKDIEDLQLFVQSPEFRQKEKMKPVTFKDTEEYGKWLEFKKLKGDKEIRKNLNPEKVKRFSELQTLVTSSAFLLKKNMKPVTFKDTPEYQKLQEFKIKKGASDVVSYYKFRSSGEYHNWVQVKDSARLKRFYELQEYLKTKEFNERKEYLLDKRRFEKSEMFRELKEYEALKNSPDIKWYFSVKDSNKFDILKNRELTFSDEFEGTSPDSSKWLNKYYWGEKLLHDSYSIATDLQCYTPSENLEVRHSVLRIITKPQKINGKVWDQSKGFYTKDFSFTSGIINTGATFRQKYGTFTAKIKLTDPNVRNAFWLIGDRITPHVNVCRSGHGKVWFDLFTAPGSHHKKSLGSKYLSDFYIYTLEWTPDAVVWKINGMEVMRQTTGVPQEPMYINLAGGVDKPIGGISSMEVDWVRVYRQK
ncbi:glycosyl hydrolase family protein, partial [bacterium]|nr:glycosyl hydrolase family protein [bacterium]